LLAEALRSEPERSAPLAQLVQEKTGGNPFFTTQFISSLAEEKMLAFDHDAGCWSWDLDRIHAKGYTDNVVDLMIGKLIRLPAQTQTALQQLACLGNLAESAILSIVLEKTQEQVHSTLWESVRQGLVERLDGSPTSSSMTVFRKRLIHWFRKHRAPKCTCASDAAGGAHPSRKTGRGDLRHRQSSEPGRSFDVSFR
jgi:predicted ATPase